MKKTSFLIAILLIISTVSTFAWISSLARASMVVSMKNNAGSNISLATSKTGTFGDSIVADNTFSISPCASTDGITFVDESNASSNEYAQLLFYVKGDKDYDSLYVDNITISPATAGIKVAVEYDSLCTILNVGSFTRTKLNKPVGTSPKAVKIRVWFDGNSITEYISGNISIAVDFSAE